MRTGIAKILLGRCSKIVLDTSLGAVEKGIKKSKVFSKRVEALKRLDKVF